MKKQLLQTTAILLLTLISTSIFAQKKLKYDKTYFDKFPSYEAVIEAYFTENNFDYQNVIKIKFAKKYEGWYVIFLNEKFEETEEQRIWNAKKSAFEKLKTEGTDDGGTEAVEEGKRHFIRGLKPVWLKQYPVYGYHGYEDDVIELLENEQNLSAELLDALARSYSSKCMETITPGQFGGKSKIMEYDRTLNPKDWEKETLDKFILYADKSIAAFRILSDKYPDYQTVVGNIRTKYKNEHLAVYYALKYSGKPELGEKYLVDDLYDDFQIKTAANYLKTCANNAILFTSGDNDTYPLIYAQDKLGIRPDVKIINISLANLGRYIHFIKSEFNLPTTLETSDYQLGKNDFMIIKSEIEDVELRDFFKMLNEEKNIYTDDNAGVHYLPARQGFFVIEPKPLGYQLGVAKRFSESAVRLNFNKSYISKGEIFILDLITRDNWQTPIYFSSGSHWQMRGLGMFDYIKSEGLAYRFLPKAGHDVSRLEYNIFNNFDYPNAEGVDWYSSDNDISLTFYLIAFQDFLNRQKNNPEKVEKALNKMEAVFPHLEVSYKSHIGDLADFCYDLGLTERGDAFIINESNHVHAYFKSIENKEILSFFDKQMIQRMLYTANQLVTIAEINERDAFAGLADDFAAYLTKYGE